MIEFEGVTKVFPGGTVAVDDISLVAPAGRITVLMGPRGCGKTTLLRMVNRMLDPSAGRVLINGAPNTNVRRSQLRRGIGYLAAGGLFPHRTVARNIETVPLLIGSDRTAARDRAMALLQHVGLPTSFADKYPGQLSQGQQVRVGLARALAADPPVLLLDAPFTSLEPAVRQDIQDDLLELQRIAPKTILFATEDIDEAIKLGDQIAVVDGGRVVQLATPQVLLTYPGSDYVAELLGRDRGIRKLTFLPAGDLPLIPAATVQAGTTGSRARAIADSQRERWLLVLDPDRRPRGWVDSAVLGPDQIVSGPVVHPLGGTFYPDESVLAALDAAILSPPGLAVCLDDDGKTLGVVSHTEIARYLQSQPPVPGYGQQPPHSLSAFDAAMAEQTRFDAAPKPARGFTEAIAPAPEPVVERPAPEPVFTKAPEPVVQRPAPEPVVAKAPDPVVAEAEPVVATKAPEPVVAKAPEPVAKPADLEKTDVLPVTPAARVEEVKAPARPVTPMPEAATAPLTPIPTELNASATGPIGPPPPVIKETSKPTTPVAVPTAASTPRPVTPRPVNGPSQPASAPPPPARSGPVPAPSERGRETIGEPVAASTPAAASSTPAAETETKAETPRRSSVSGGWEWRSDLGQWVQVEPDAAGATAGDGSNR